MSLQKWTGKIDKLLLQTRKSAYELAHPLRVLYARSRGFRMVNCFWYRCGDNGKNFGDLIGPELLRSLGYYPLFTRASNPKLDLVSAGSVLEQIPESYRGIILGAGFISKEADKRFPNATILAVRGCLTLEKLKGDANVVLGDPGLILCDMVQRQKKRFEIGIIPHYIDKKDPRLLLLRKRFKGKIAFIDVLRPATEVVKDVDKCAMILSSSLHGCIVSDSLDIPNVHIQFNELIGGNFKFDDYYSVYGASHKSIQLTGNETYVSLTNMPNTPPKGVSCVQSQLRHAFCRLPYHLYQANQ